MSTKMQRWIEETQRFQRIAGVDVSSTEDLTNEWLKFNTKQKAFALKNAEEHRVIQDAAINAGNAWKNKD